MNFAHFFTNIIGYWEVYRYFSRKISVGEGYFLREEFSIRKGASGGEV